MAEELVRKRSWLEINLDNLARNVKQIQKVMSENTIFMAIVKANGYGHGSVVIAKELNRIGVFAFGVATIDEGIILRKEGIQGEILILGSTIPARAKELFRYDLIQTVVDTQYGQLLNEQGIRLKVHLKIDTGMHRLGCDYQDIKGMVKLFQCSYLETIGIFTHLCVSDSLQIEDVQYTKQQITNFYSAIQNLKKQGIRIPKTHIQSSYGVLNYPHLTCDYARIGIAMYGVKSTLKGDTLRKVSLQPVLSLKSQVVLIRRVKAGDTIGYGCAHTMTQNGKIAVVPIGYGDGIPRNITRHSAYVLIKGQKAPIIGRVCMDQMIVDISNIPSVKLQDIVTILGQDGNEHITAATMAAFGETISNEILSRIGDRLPRIYSKEKIHAT